MTYQLLRLWYQSHYTISATFYLQSLLFYYSSFASLLLQHGFILPVASWMCSSSSSVWWNLCSVFYRDGLIAINSFSLLLWEAFFLLQLWWVILLGIIYLYVLLGFKVSLEKPAIILMWLPLYATCCSLVDLNMFSLLSILIF